MADSTTLNFGDIPTDCIDFSVFQDNDFEKLFRKIYLNDPEGKLCIVCYPNYSMMLYATAYTHRPNKENILDPTLEHIKWLIPESFKSFKTAFRDCTFNKTDCHNNLDEAVQCRKCIKITLKCIPEVLRMMYTQPFQPPLDFCVTGTYFHHYVMKMLYDCKMGCLPVQRTLHDFL